MKIVRKTLSVLFIVLFAISMAGCLAKNDVPSKIVNAAKGYGIEEVGSRTDLIKISAKLTSEGAGFYRAKNIEEATKLYKSYFNARKNLPDIDADDFIAISVKEKGDAVIHVSSVYSATFKNKDDAKEVFDKLSEIALSSLRILGKDKGEKSNYSYAIAYEKNTVSTTILGIYLQGKSVTYLQAYSYKDELNAFALYFCGKMGYISPEEIIES